MMAGSLSITISSTSALGSFGTRRAEAVELADVIATGMAQLVSSHSQSITLRTRNGASVGSIAWTPATS